MFEYLLTGGQQGGGEKKKDVPRNRTLEGDDMAQDPNCKVYVPVSRSVVRKIGGETHYFCSEECASNYLKTLK